MKDLTKAEEQIMQILWKLKKAFVKEIIQDMPEPKPAYNTVSTIIRILDKKEIVGHEEFGKSHRYYPLISKKDYSASRIKHICQNYFSRSYSNMVSSLTEENNLSVTEMEELKSLLEVELSKRKES